MSLNWQWKDKCGELETDQGTLTLYQGNAYLIMLNEFEERGQQYYSLYGFFDDKVHMKRCLGLLPKEGYSDNLYDGHFKAIRLNKAKCIHWREIVAAFAEAFDEIRIEVFKDA